MSLVTAYTKLYGLICNAQQTTMTELWVSVTDDTTALGAVLWDMTPQHFITINVKFRHNGFHYNFFCI